MTVFVEIQYAIQGVLVQELRLLACGLGGCQPRLRQRHHGERDLDRDGQHRQAAQVLSVKALAQGTECSLQHTNISELWKLHQAGVKANTDQQAQASAWNTFWEEKYC